MEKIERPIIRIPLTKTEIIFEMISLAGLFVNVFLIAYYWSGLPERVPGHFGINGRPDMWSGKASLIILPVVSIFLYALLTLVRRKPQGINYLVKITGDNAEKQYRLVRRFLSVIKIEIIWVFAFINWIAIKVAFGQCNGLGILFLPLFLILVFGTIGIYINKSSNTG
nr:DUF1648 domain-containing protein [candidate division Zixibacteria bacterium]